FTFLTAANATLLLSQEDTAPSYTVGQMRTYREAAAPPPVAEIQQRLAAVHIGPADAYQGARLLAQGLAAAHPGVEKPLITLLADAATLTAAEVDPAQVPAAWEVYFSSPDGAHLTVVIDAATGTFVRAH